MKNQIGMQEVESELPFAMLFLHFSPVSHRDQMKDSEIMYYKNGGFSILKRETSWNFFLLFLVLLFGFAFWFFSVFTYFLFLHYTSKTEKIKK